MRAFDFWIILALMLIATVNVFRGDLCGLILTCTFILGQHIRIYGGKRE